MFILCHKLIQIISVLSVCLAAYKFNCCNLQFLDNVIFIKTKVLLSQAEVTLSGTWYPIIRYLVSYYPVLGILLSGTWYPIIRYLVSYLGPLVLLLSNTYIILHFFVF